MRLVFVRHGEPQRADADPGLTSAGRRMAYETGAWLASLELRPRFIRHTPTTRTRETAEELAISLVGAPLGQGRVSPELVQDWERLAEELSEELSGGLTGVLVGHHPTVGLLLDRYGPPPVPVPRRNLAVAILLERGASGGWRIHQAWPGRPAL